MRDPAILRLFPHGSLVARACIGAAVLATFVMGAFGGDAMAQVVSFSCQSSADGDNAESICEEFLDVLRERHPSHEFVRNAGVGPGIELTVTHANDRGLGLKMDWIPAEGQVRHGAPMQTAFFDRKSALKLRRNFYVIFLQHNPLPF